MCIMDLRLLVRLDQYHEYPGKKTTTECDLQISQVDKSPNGPTASGAGRSGGNNVMPSFKMMMMGGTGGKGNFDCELPSDSSDDDEDAMEEETELGKKDNSQKILLFWNLRQIQTAVLQGTTKIMISPKLLLMLRCSECLNGDLKENLQSSPLSSPSHSSITEKIEELESCTEDESSLSKLAIGGQFIHKNQLSNKCVC
ncbi:hypothetical protein QL285_032532 [Trifolium repens]|nr:hypothetical protein QL285_032532 [Trifolium repens]